MITFCTAYMCHHNTFLLYSAMKERTEVAWTKATHVSVSISCLVIIICAVAGYSTFTGFTQGRLGRTVLVCILHIPYRTKPTLVTPMSSCLVQVGF